MLPPSHTVSEPHKTNWTVSELSSVQPSYCTPVHSCNIATLPLCVRRAEAWKLSTTPVPLLIHAAIPNFPAPKLLSVVLISQDGPCICPSSHILILMVVPLICTRIQA